MSTFHFKHFSVQQSSSAMKIGTDAMVLGALIDATGKSNALDIGAGTGVLSLMVAQKKENVSVTAVEIDHDAAQECALNISDSPWNDRMNVIHLDVLRFESGETYDLIFSNPPYYQSRLVNEDERKALARHESFLPAEKLVLKINELLSDTGDAWLIVPTTDVDAWIKQAEEVGLSLHRRIDISGKPGKEANRTVICVSKTARPTSFETLIIRNESGKYSEEYKRLTIDYHGVTL